tara:strand:+ start:1815 stop:2396 length:582 start_codon:yes stop_codon:yes gene_type:complete
MSLKLIIGPMYSGKSFELIKTIRELKILDLPFLVIKPKIDNRYTEEDYIVTHNMDKEVCMVIEDMYELLKMDTLDSYKYLIIDEGQFIKNLCEVSKILVDNLGKNLVIAGLDGDFNREPIGELLNLIPFSDECIKKKSKCIKCKDRTEAPFTFKIINNNNIIDVGSVDKYIPLCRKHYIFFTKLKNDTAVLNI